MFSGIAFQYEINIWFGGNIILWRLVLDSQEHLHGRNSISINCPYYQQPPFHPVNRDGKTKHRRYNVRLIYRNPTA